MRLLLIKMGLLFCYGNFLFSQTIERDLSSSGGGLNTDIPYMAFTLAEPIVGTHITNDLVLTQGMQQGNTLNAVDLLELSIAPVSIFPNPSKGFFHIEGLQYISAEKLVVYDILGIPRKSIDIKYFDGAIDLSAFSSGTYFLKIVGDKQVYKSIEIVILAK